MIEPRLNSSLSPDTVRQIVRKWCRRAGLPEISPHDLRRTYARLAREGGAPLEVIQRSLGHTSIQTTE